jgi:hypothetical protein
MYGEQRLPESQPQYPSHLYAKNLLFDRSFEKARSAAVRYDGVEKLRAMAISLVACDDASIDRYRLLATFNGYAIGDSHLMRAQQKRNERHWHVFEEVIAALQEAGSLPKSLNPRSTCHRWCTTCCLPAPNFPSPSSRANLASEASMQSLRWRIAAWMLQ